MIPGRCVRVLVFLQMFALFALAELPAPVVPNSLLNHSFENGGPIPLSWTGSNVVYSRDDGVSHAGSGSLKYSNTLKTRYELCSQFVDVPGGVTYQVGGWIKTEGLLYKNATICVEWRDRAGNYMNGVYLDGVKGTKNWTYVSGLVRLPVEANGCSVTCYVQKGGVGVAWFDDVQLVRRVEPVLQTLMTAPMYRGRITASGPEKIRVRALLNLADYNLKASGVRLSGELLDDSGGLLHPATAPGVKAIQNEYHVVMPSTDLTPGNYTAVVYLKDTAGNILSESRHEVVRMADTFAPKVAIDVNRRLQVDGKPFFPIGMYCNGINEGNGITDDLRLYADSKFNCLMPYWVPGQTQLDAAQSYGIKVIFSLKDHYFGSPWCPKTITSKATEETVVRQLIRNFRSHPALLTWYLNDELTESFIPAMEAHQRWVMEDDPDHPSWMVLTNPPATADYIKAFDVIGSDPYPVTTKPASMAADWTIETFKQVGKARPMWQVIQAFNLANYGIGGTNSRPPTYAEMRSMSWQAICEGATGILFYSWFDVWNQKGATMAQKQQEWEDLKAIAAEIDQAAPALLSQLSTPQVTVDCIPENPEWLHLLVKRVGTKRYLFVANNGDAEGEATFTIGGNPVLQVLVPAEGRSLQPTGNVFKDTFKKFDVRIYEF